MPSTRNPLLRAALAYAEWGIPVLPLHHPIGEGGAPGGHGCSCHARDCASPAKHPLADLVPHGLTDATRDLDAISAWWSRHPEANIGLATGHVFDVLDVDGPLGATSIRDFAAEHALRGTGPLVRTGSGGWHYLVAPTGLGNPSPRGLDHVDWRGRGGYVVAPPSMHHSGARYRFIRNLARPLPEVPAPLLDRLLPTRQITAHGQVADGQLLGHPYGRVALEAECAQLAALSPDSKRRNSTLYLAGLRLHSLAAGGVLDPTEVDQRLTAAAASNGLGIREIQRTIDSARRIASQHPRTIPDLPDRRLSGSRSPVVGKTAPSWSQGRRHTDPGRQR
jgi:hypothetical protein